jgi:ABC-type Fe3+/spermidine/putrescine transport system ATPase subunit
VTAQAEVLPVAPGAEVVVDSVGKTFRRGGRRTVALAGASLQVRAGELICLLGPSGCGKSTLLRIIAGALLADEGSVTVLDTDTEVFLKARRRIRASLRS